MFARLAPAHEVVLAAEQLLPPRPRRVAEVSEVDLRDLLPGGDVAGGHGDLALVPQKVPSEGS